MRKIGERKTLTSVYDCRIIAIVIGGVSFTSRFFTYFMTTLPSTFNVVQLRKLVTLFLQFQCCSVICSVMYFTTDLTTKLV